jgi:hypothetical protein
LAPGIGIHTELLPSVLNPVKDSPRDSAILHIGTFCAMRPAEVFGLHWGSFVHSAATTL